MLNELYFINSRELAKKLSQNAISEKVAFWHFLVFTIITGSVITLPIDMQWAGQEPESFVVQFFSYAGFGAIQYWGFTSLYKANCAIDGQNFFLRYAALSLPVGLQMLILSVILSAIFGAITGIASSKYKDIVPNEAWLLLGALFGAGLLAIYFKLVLAAFNDISEHRKQNHE